MAHLHELLAVESSLEGQAAKCRSDLINTFEKKRHLFEEKTVIFAPLAEGEKEVVESQLDIQSTVPKELDWLSGHIIKALDISFQVAEANTKARADVVLEDDTILLKNLPATALLELEKRVGEIRDLVNAIPTLDPAKSFAPDPNRNNIYKAREITKNRTKKTQKVIIKYEATKEHPAQTELVSEDAVVGKIREIEWSGLITPGQKANLLNRVDILSRAVRRARSRANEVEVDNNQKIGAVLIGYLFKE